MPDSFVYPNRDISGSWCPLFEEYLKTIISTIESWDIRKRDQSEYYFYLIHFKDNKHLIELPLKDLEYYAELAIHTIPQKIGGAGFLYEDFLKWRLVSGT
jgi:hypothetical protein